MVLSSAYVLGVSSAWWWGVRRPEFAAALDAWAKRHSRETDRAIIKAYADGHQDGQEFERLRGSEPRG